MILPIDDVVLTLSPGRAAVDDDTRGRIAAHWATVVAANPALWNGTVFGVRAPGTVGGLRIEAGVLRGEAVEWDFASFLAWRDWGFPEIGLRNLFGSALVTSGDGALIYGVMGPRTANVGRIYPPGGSLEPRDRTADGRLDVFRSVDLELAEETGLAVGDAELAATLVAYDGPRVSVGRVLRFPGDADELAGRIRAFLAADADPELADVAVIRRAGEAADPRFPPYARLFAEHLLPA